MTTTVRIPPRLEQRLTQYCVEARRSKSEVIIELLEQRFAAQPAAKTPYEIAAEVGLFAAHSAVAPAAAEPAGAGTSVAQQGCKAGLRP